MLEPEELIGKFYLSIKDKYPDLTLQDITLVCQAPFIFLREQMAKVTLPQIRFKYWGVYKVKAGRLKALPEIIEDAESKSKTKESTILRLREIQKLKSE